LPKDNSFFNDSYILPDGAFDNFTDVNISLKSDRRVYKVFNSKYNESIQWLKNYTDFPGQNLNEHFLVWIRPAAMPNFMKLYMKCNNCKIEKGLYQIQVRMNYPTSIFPGERWLVLSSTGILGSGSNFISIAYLSAGGMGIFFGVIFLIHMLFWPRQFGDLSMLWQTHDMGQLGIALNPSINRLSEYEPKLESKDDDNGKKDSNETSDEEIELNDIES